MVFQGDVSEYKWTLKELNPDLPSDWSGYNYLVLELKEYDLTKIDVRGEKLEAVRRKYQLHQDIERELQWMGPLLELPNKLG